MAAALLLSFIYLLLSPIQRENQVFLTVAQWFSGQGMKGAVAAKTSLPARNAVLPPRETPSCFENYHPPSSLAESFTVSNRQQRDLTIHRRTLERAVSSSATVPFFEGLAERLLGGEAPASAVDKRLIFSRVGFNKEKDEAIVYVEYLCPLCGYGGYFYLQDTNAGWVIRDLCARWES